MSNWQLRRAANLLLRGGVIAYPTETVWGLGCLPTNQQAVQRILSIKGRRFDKGLIIIASEAAQLVHWIGDLSSTDWQKLATPLVRPTTWIVPASSYVPNYISGGRSTLAVRITTQPEISKLCSLVGPIVSTSANRSGKLVLRSRFQCIQQFLYDVDSVLPGECNKSARSSTIIDLLSGHVLRS